MTTFCLGKSVLCVLRKVACKVVYGVNMMKLIFVHQILSLKFLKAFLFLFSFVSHYGNEYESKGNINQAGGKISNQRKLQPHQI